MNKLLIIVFLSFSVNCMAQTVAEPVIYNTNSQVIQIETKPGNTAKIEKMKKETNAPDYKNFSTEKDYQKAKEDWVKNNKQTYEAIISESKKKGSSQPK